MLMREQLLKDLEARLTYHALSTRTRSASNLHDQALLSEVFYAELLNELLDLSLVSTNWQAATADTVDLADAARRTVVQVTAREDRAKIEETIASFIAGGMQARFDTLYFVIIGWKPKYKKDFSAQGTFSFSHEEHVLSVPELVRGAGTLPLGKLQTLAGIARDNIALGPDGSAPKRERLQSLWRDVGAVNALVQRAVDPGIDGQLTPGPSYDQALEILRSLEQKRHDFALSMAGSTKDATGDYIQEAYVALDAVRVLRDATGPGEARDMDAWAKAHSAWRRLDRLRQELERALQGDLRQA